MKILPTGLYNLLLFNLLFFKDENLEIGFATKALLEKLLNEDDITNQQFNRFLTAAKARVLSFDTRRSERTSNDQLLYFIKRYVMYFLGSMAKYLLRKPLRLYSQIPDCAIIMFVFRVDEKKS